ncbi:porin family protein [Peristeroidobacter agariperforans]|uniref:porin family protein n=1 Tax=Peristeroidobacter agariperforans TaxID=268404 RepID=UPI00130018C7|nr:porin family protein [Peristeroidobacter agariperforans]
MHTSISRSLRHACVVLTIALFSSHAMADDNDSGIYVGAGYGEFDTKIENVEGVTDVIGNIDTDDSAFKIFAGWRFNKFISLEADYIDLGNPRGNFDASGSDGDYNLELSGFGAYVIGTLPITIFELSAKVGYYFHDVELDVNLDNIGGGNGNVLHTDDSGEALVYGVGAGVTFIDHINVLLEYELMDFDEVDDSNVLWLSAAWRF